MVRAFKRNDNEVNCLVLADMHWGAIPVEKMQSQVQNVIMSYIDDLEGKGVRLNFIFIAGDLFDTNEKFSSPVALAVIKFLSDLLYATENMGTDIILINGTRSHDSNQLSTLAEIFGFTWYDDSRIIAVNNVYQLGSKYYNIGTDDFNVLLLPEEYVKDQDAYYEKYFQDQYDLIIGHGMVDKIWYAKPQPEAVLDMHGYHSEDNDFTVVPHAPVFEVDKLLNHCKRCYFGHVHTHVHYGDDRRFSYVGPFTNWDFGKATDVGFYHVTKYRDTGEVKDVYIHNTESLNYPTVSITINEEISLEALNDQIDTLIAGAFASAENIGSVRLIIYTRHNIPNYKSIEDFMAKKVGNLQNVKTIFRVDNTTEAEANIAAREEQKLNSYLFNPTLDVAEKIQSYIKNKSGREIPIDTINKYLNS